MVFIAVFVGAALFAPFLAPSARRRASSSDRLETPSREHIMGTDLQGRDEYSRVLYGAQVSLVAGIASVVMGVFIGGAIGAAAGGIGGRVDSVLMRVVDVMLAIPGILLAIGIVAWLGRGLPQIIFAVAVVNVPIFARILRGSLLSLRDRTTSRRRGRSGASARDCCSGTCCRTRSRRSSSRPRSRWRPPSSTSPGSGSWASARRIHGPRSGARC